MATVQVDVGSLFKGRFALSVSMRNCTCPSKMETFTKALVASLGGSEMPFTNVTQAQLIAAERLGKMFCRLDDTRNYPGERANALRVIQQMLDKLAWSEAGLRSVHEALEAGVDSEVPMLGTLKFIKRVTSRRQWFEDLADVVCKPLWQWVLQGV